MGYDVDANSFNLAYQLESKTKNMKSNLRSVKTLSINSETVSEIENEFYSDLGSMED